METEFDTYIFNLSGLPGDLNDYYPIIETGRIVEVIDDD
jgi:hypothetical protein